MKYLIQTVVAVMLVCGNLWGAHPSVESVIGRSVVNEGNNARLKDFFAKAEAGSHLVVATLGGSITQGFNASSSRFRYADRIVEALQKKFPKSHFELINAGVGATGSKYGVLRLQRDLFCRRPDLVIFEYAVNDGPYRDEYETFEALIRQSFNAPWKPAVTVLLNFRPDMDGVQISQTDICRHYGIPAVSVQKALMPEIEAKRLAWKEHSNDKVHPTDAGHGFIASLYMRFLEKAWTKTADVPISVIPEPLYSKIFDRTAIFEAEELRPVKNNGWHFNLVAPHESGWESSEPGSTIEFSISGETIVFMYWKVNGNAGIVEVQVDDLPPRRCNAWFPKTWGGYIATFVAARNLPDTRHTVKVRLLAEKHRLAKGHAFRIIALGSAAKK